MDRRRRAVVPGVERLEGVEGLAGQPDLAHDQPVGPHPQGVRDEVADVEQPALGLAAGEVVGVDRLEVEAVGVVERELGRVLDDAHPLGRVERIGERAQERRLAGTRLTRHEHVRPRAHEARQHLGHVAGQPALGHPVTTVPAAGPKIEPQAVELADREVRPADRWQDGVDPRAVGHPGVDDRVGDRELAARQRRDPLRDLDELAVRAQTHAGGLEATRALDEHRVGPVDQDVRDVGVLDQRLQGSETTHGRLDRGDQGRHRGELELGILEDGRDRRCARAARARASGRTG